MNRIFVLLAMLFASAGSLAGQPTFGKATPLAVLIAEAEQNNPQVAAAESNWRAATHVSRQVTTLPDPHFTVQELSVGSPKPFAGFSNSDFSYIGFGASQDLPYPGKRRLRGEVAEREADTRRKQVDSVRTLIVQQLKLDYFRVAYLQRTLQLLLDSGTVLDQLVTSATDRYRVGQGDQQEILHAQLQRTRLRREIALHHQEVGMVQVELKQLLHRSQLSPEIVAERLTPSAFNVDQEHVAETLRDRNPAIAVANQFLQKQSAEVELAKREGRPDFNIGYQYQRTGSQFRDYYVATFGIQLPRRSRQSERVAEVVAMQERAKQELDAELQSQLASAQNQLVIARTTAELLKVYKEGLIPQSEARFRAGLAGYQVNRQTFAAVLTSFTDTLTLQMEYEQTLADHESAIARLEALTGRSIR